MYNKIKHSSPTQSIPDMEFKQILRGESPYYGNLNRPAQSAYDLSNTVALIQSWSGTVSIVQQLTVSDTFMLYEIVKLNDGETISKTTSFPGNLDSRYGIVVAEAVIDSSTGFPKNIVVCTFCPNFVYPTRVTVPGFVGDSLYLNGDTGVLKTTPAIGSCIRILAKKTGTKTIFFSGVATLW